MPPFQHTHLKTPEEVELEKKNAELARFSTQLTEREARFNALKYEIRMFEQRYEELLGQHITTLEELEWQINGMLGVGGQPDEPVTARPASDAFTYFHHRTDLLDEGDLPQGSPVKSFKTLYRDVAKTIHPDLSPDEGERKRRQELMAIANKAYAEGDRKTLEDILYEWEPPRSCDPELDIALALVKVIREIARVQQDIYAMGCKIDELKTTDIYLFKLRVDEAQAEGIDLLAEMAIKVERDITRAQNRLSLLRGETVEPVNGVTSPLETRIIRFPDSPCGVVFERTRGSVDFRDWKQLGTAHGTLELFLDKAIRLDVRGGGDGQCSFLATLQPDDIQALFLYEVGDAVLPSLSGLHGLEELYLSNTTISDRGLLQLGSLKSLQRLYLYHTPVSDMGLMYLSRVTKLKGLTCSGTEVTDEGLERFRGLAPGCKAVSFKWRYD